ncbi:hypothetical protein MHF_0536 [Mycoplasma haemofelis Ohio2]|uniref:Uncharacterized protein n=1 Tax=Mycoplasma haemofelis (strain Ohio2) TaxID=859194 RepID=F6FHW0_MYCHI|nr:hypothetical protein MHF_0536 [Mycoplasma haemofelis Ohio2]
MALDPLTKGGIALAGGASAATGGYLVYSNISSSPNQTETFRSKITSSGRLLIENNDSQWNVKVAIYGKNGNSNKITIGGQEKSTLTKDELSHWCSDNLRLEYPSKNSSLFSLVEKWCIVPSIKEALSRESKAIIPVGDSLDNGWQSKISAKQQNVKSDLIDTLKLTSESSGSNNTVKPEVLRDWCKGRLELVYTSDTENHYSLSKDWCLQQ